MAQATFRWTSMPRAVRRALRYCDPLLTYRTGPGGVSMYVQFRVPSHLHALMAAHADDTETIGMTPSVQPVPAQELLRRAASDPAPLRFPAARPSE